LFIQAGGSGNLPPALVAMAHVFAVHVPAQNRIYSGERFARGKILKKKRLLSTSVRRAPSSGGATARLPSTQAKITIPSANRVLNRVSVFNRLDGFGARRLIWLAAPAGYGKTTAVVTYLQSRRIPPIWYQCDEGDADIASFFHYLSLALHGAVRQQLPPMAAFSVENFASIPAFARTFFRAWFSYLPAGTAWVMDDWQDLPSPSPLSDLLPVIIEEMPEGIQLIVISRRAPAANLSRLVAGHRMAQLTESDLRLSPEETGRIAAMYTRAKDQQRVLSTAQLYESTGGWAAGVTVMLRHDAETFAKRARGARRSMQTVFNLLSMEVFDRLDPEVRELLINTACLDYVAVPVAEQLSHEQNARDILDALVEQNAFTTHRAASDTYHYHPLFLEFLRSRLEATLNLAARRELWIAAAQELAKDQDPEQAIHLLLQAEDWSGAATLIVVVAPLVAQQTRFPTLAAWIARLPANASAGHPWIAYWHAVAQMAIDFPSARPSLDLAYALFEESADPLGRMLTAAGILRHIAYSYLEFGSMRPWIERLVELLNAETPFPSPLVELRVMSSLLLGLSQAQPHHPILRHCVARVSKLVDAPMDLASSADAVAALLHFFGMCGTRASYRALDRRVKSLLTRIELGPAARIHILRMDAYQHFLRGALAGSHAFLDAAEAIAREQRLVAFELPIQVSRLQMWDVHGHRDELAAHFADLEPGLARSPPIIVAHARWLRAMYLLAIDDPVGAQVLMGEATRLFANAGWVFVQAMMQVAMAEIRVEQQRFAEAERFLANCDQLVLGIDAPILSFNSGLVRAEIARRTRPSSEFAAALAPVFAIGREQRFANTFHAYGLLLPRLIPYALGLDVEIAYCRWVIQRRSLAPPLADVPHWPWPVRIKATGHLDVYVGGAPLEFPGKSQRKPIDLLKALITRKAGVDTARLMDALWPDLDGDAARHAFDLAVHRLRKLLKHKDAVQLSQGRLSLNPRLVWVDAFVLQRLSTEGFAEAHLSASVPALLTLYRGPLLADDDGPAIVAARQRLRSHFIRSVAALADRLEGAQQRRLVASLCRQAIDLEPLEEELYRIWIRSLIARGHDAEAEAVYRRCEEMLDPLLRAKRSKSTRASLVAKRWH